MSFDRLTFPSIPSEPAQTPQTPQPAASSSSFAALYSEAMQAEQIASADSSDLTEPAGDWMTLIPAGSATYTSQVIAASDSMEDELTRMRAELMHHVKSVGSIQGQAAPYESTGAVSAATSPVVRADIAASTTQQGESKLTSGVHRLISWIDTHAHLHSTHHCAASVRQAMEAAGMTTSDRPTSGDAGDYGPFLLRHGAAVIPLASYQPQSGDIAVFDRSADHPAGHIQVFDGQRWVSDFVQNTFSPYRDQSSTPPVTVYRLT